MATPIGDDELSELHLDILACARCSLRHTATKVVPGRGPQSAEILVVGEAPGSNEDKTGKPFVGRAGDRLSAWLKAARINQDDVYISNCLKCRPPKNRFPDDTGPSSPPRRCIGWLRKQIEIIKPQAIVLAGARALQFALFDGTVEQSMPFTPHAGKTYRRRDTFGATRFSVIFHPAYMLRRKNPAEEKLVVQTLCGVRDYVHAKKRRLAAPIEEITDIRTAPAPQHQQRFRLFQENDS